MSDPQHLDGLLRWRNIGPFRGGRVVAVAGSYDDQNTFYFGAAAGGVWKTTDAGSYWQPVTDGFLNTSSIGALAVAPSDSNVIYAGTGETTIRIDVSHGDGVYKSTDAGNTWSHIGLEDTRHIGKIRVHPQDPDTVWVAALGHAFGPNKERGVFKSTDGGQTWNHVLFVSEKAGAVDLTVDESNPRILYASIWEAYRSPWQISSGGPDSGLWRSTDGGETWTNISAHQGLPTGTWGKVGVSASPAQSGRVWALIEHTKEGGLYRSDDFGVTWTKVSDNQNLLSRAWYYIHITADPVDANTVYVNNLAFYRSTDGGKNFSEIDTPHGDNHDMWIDPKDNRRFIQGNDGGANITVNGGISFTTIYNQPTAQFYHIHADNNDPYNVYGTQQDNTSLAVPSRVNHATITWQDNFIAGTGESGYIVTRPDDPDIVYVGAIGSSPGGGNSLQRYDRRTDQIRLITSWPESARGVGAGEMKQRFNWTYPIVISPHDPNTLYIGGDRILKSTDEGQSWTPISPDLSKADPETLQPSGGPVNKDALGAETYATVYALIESPHQQGLFWAGTDDGLIHISKDNGKNWTNITPSELPEWALVSCIEPHPTEVGTVYVAATKYKLDDYQPYLFKTTDFGETWTRINNGIPEDDFTRVIRADAEQPGLLFAGTETGIYVSYDDGNNWSRFQLNFPVTPVYDLIIKGSDLIAGTHGRSIWILDDINPLRRVAAGLPSSDPFLFTPRETVRMLPGVEWGNDNLETVNYASGRAAAHLATMTPDGELQRTYLDSGENAPRGAIITYRLASAPEEPITLTFKNAKGEEVRSFTSRTADDEVIAKERRAPANEGWNRFLWDLRWAPATKVQGTDPISQMAVEGPHVAPGEYTVTLKVGDQELTESFTVVKPSTYPATQEDLEAQEDLLLRIHRKVDETAKNINRMRDLREQLSGLAKRTKDTETGADVAKAADELREKVLEIETTLHVPDLRPGWGDTGNAGTRLFERLMGLTGAVNLGDYRPTDVAEEVYTHFVTQIDEQVQAFEALIAAEVPKIAEAANKANVGVIIVA